MTIGDEVIKKTACACWAKVNPGKDCPADKIPSMFEIMEFAAARVPPQVPNNTGALLRRYAPRTRWRSV